jgi:hypothetical protein
VVTRSNSAPVVNGNEPLNAQARFLRMLTSKVSDGTGWSLSFFEFWAEGPTSPPPPSHHRHHAARQPIRDSRPNSNILRDANIRHGAADP